MAYTLKGKIAKAHPYQLDPTLSVYGAGAEAEATGKAIEAVKKTAEEHFAKTDNPHKVTKTQVGLGNVDNTSDTEKPVSALQAEAIAKAKEIAEDHINNNDNPHKVTKGQVGLGNVDNTSDTEKPVSTAQALAIADAKKAGTDAQAAADKAQAAADKAQSEAKLLKSYIGNARMYSGEIDGTSFDVTTEWVGYYFFYFDDRGNVGTILKGKNEYTYVKLAGSDITLSYVDDKTVKLTVPNVCSHAYVMLISGLPLVTTLLSHTD